MSEELKEYSQNQIINDLQHIIKEDANQENMWFFGFNKKQNSNQNSENGSN